MLPQWLSGKESTCNEGDPGSILGLGRSPGGGPGNALHRGAWRATVHGVAELDTTEATEHTAGLEPLSAISSCSFSWRLSSRSGSFSFLFLLPSPPFCSLSFSLLPSPSLLLSFLPSFLSPLPSFPNNCVQMPLGGARQGWRLHRVSGNPVPGRWGAGGVWVLSVSRVFLSSGVA